MSVIAVKTLLMPSGAYCVARWGFHASPTQLLTVTMLAALPAAQNINTYASVYQRNEALARDAILWTTVVSIPIIVVIVALLGP
ncbi:MAG: hypothetical protein ACRDUX_26205 [Mycobacterium sp.]